jgi:hypothetical protein
MINKKEDILMSMNICTHKQLEVNLNLQKSCKDAPSCIFMEKHALNRFQEFQKMVHEQMLQELHKRDSQ